METDYFLNLILDDISTFLKNRGYRKRGLSFYLEREDLTCLINIQKSLKSNQGNLIVTVNLGVFLKPLAIKLGDEIKSPNVSDCHWRQRIGNIMPNGFDKWWEVSNTKEANQASHDIVTMLTDWGIPVLDNLSSLEKVIALWKDGISPGVTEGLRQRYLAILGNTK